MSLLLSDSAQTENSGLKVLVAHENEMTRLGLGAMLFKVPSVTQVDTRANLTEVAGLLASRTFNVLILACSDEGIAGRLATEAADHGVKALLLLDSADPQHLAQAAEPLADGFLVVSDLTADYLEEELRRLSRGQMPMPASLARELVVRIRQDGRTRSDRPLFTARELQVLSLLKEGLSNEQIGRRLGISVHGAKRHVANIMAKMNCSNRTLAVVQAMRDGLL